jgi:hypothetical protein
MAPRALNRRRRAGVVCCVLCVSGWARDNDARVAWLVAAGDAEDGRHLITHVRVRAQDLDISHDSSSGPMWLLVSDLFLQFCFCFVLDCRERQAATTNEQQGH